MLCNGNLFLSLAFLYRIQVVLSVSGEHGEKTQTVYLFLNINQLDALNFIISLFQASTCFEHKCSKHLDAWNKLIIKFSASSWLILRNKYIEMHGQQNIKKKTETDGISTTVKVLTVMTTAVPLSWGENLALWGHHAACVCICFSHFQLFNYLTFFHKTSFENFKDGITKCSEEVYSKVTGIRQHNIQLTGGLMMTC